MTVPPYVVACVACLTTGYLSDRFASRALFMIFWNIIGIIGMIMQVSTSLPRSEVAAIAVNAASDRASNPNHPPYLRCASRFPG